MSVTLAIRVKTVKKTLRDFSIHHIDDATKTVTDLAVGVLSGRMSCGDNFIYSLPSTSNTPGSTPRSKKQKNQRRTTGSSPTTELPAGTTENTPTTKTSTPTTKDPANITEDTPTKTNLTITQTTPTTNTSDSTPEATPSVIYVSSSDDEELQRPVLQYRVRMQIVSATILNVAL